MQRVLVLGATSAIAAQVAHLYARRDAALYLVGRDPGKLAEVRARVGPALVGHACADLAQCDANEQVVAAGIEALGGLDVAIVAHGLLGDQLATQTDWAHAHEVLHTNLSSPISLLIPLANHLEAAGGGDLAVLSSVAGERGRPRNFTYGAAKAGLTVYTQGLRSRLWPAGVGVHTFKLGPVDTPMTATHTKNPLFADVDTVARQIVEGIDRRVGEAYVPGYWRPILGVVRRLPESWFQRIGALSGR